VSAKKVVATPASSNPLSMIGKQQPLVSTAVYSICFFIINGFDSNMWTTNSVVQQQQRLYRLRRLPLLHPVKVWRNPLL
jgi:hypothetical protein